MTGSGGSTSREPLPDSREAGSEAWQEYQALRQQFPDTGYGPETPIEAAERIASDLAVRDAHPEFSDRWARDVLLVYRRLVPRSTAPE